MIQKREGRIDGRHKRETGCVCASNKNDGILFEVWYKIMIGFWNYTVVLTYISLAISIFGMTEAMNEKFTVAIFCLALSGLCDMFDGKIARSKKDRTTDEKNFGIQIDSLCDVVCFGAFPGMLCYLLGVRGMVGVVIIVFYGICSVVRLGFFNVLEANRQKEEEGANKYYHGLPITSMAIALPLVYFLQLLVPDEIFLIILHLMLMIVGMLFIVDFKLRKPNNKMLALLVIIVGAAVLAIIILPMFGEINFKFPPKIHWGRFR